MATLKQCDRCGKIIKHPYSMKYELIDKDHRADAYSYERELELCVDCKDDLTAFIRGDAIERVKKVGVYEPN